MPKYLPCRNEETILDKSFNNDEKNIEYTQPSAQTYSELNTVK